MRQEFRPFDFELMAEFPDATLVAGYEGGACYVASRNSSHYAIFDSRTMADFVDDENDLDELVRVVVFPSLALRDEYVRDFAGSASQRKT